MNIPTYILKMSEQSFKWKYSQVFFHEVISVVNKVNSNMPLSLSGHKPRVVSIPAWCVYRSFKNPSGFFNAEYLTICYRDLYHFDAGLGL